jgi:hypothetical protein
MTTATVSDRLRNWLDQNAAAPRSDNVCAEHAERAESPLIAHSANCAHSAQNNVMQESRLLAEADIVTGDMPLLVAAKAAFAEAEVIEARRDRYIASNPRRQPVIDLIWPIEQVDVARARDLAAAWMERIAICEIDGGLSPEDAEDIALEELRESICHLANDTV